MKTKAVILLAISVLLVAGVTAQQQESFTEVKKQFNQAQIPDALGSIIGDQTINVDINGDNSTKELGVEMDGVKIQKVNSSDFEDPTLEVDIEAVDLEEIARSRNSVKELSQKFQNGEIDYEAHGLVNSIRFFLAEQVISLASLL